MIYDSSLGYGNISKYFKAILSDLHDNCSIKLYDNLGHKTYASHKSFTFWYNCYFRILGAPFIQKPCN